MKRWPLVMTFLLFLALCASVAGWAVQWMKPAPRAVTAAAPAQQPVLAVELSAASTLFGSPRSTAPAGANYALNGVIVAPVQGVAIIAVDGKPAQAIRVGADVVPGVSVKEVHPRFVLLSERGAEKRLDLVEKKPDMLAQASSPQRTGAGETRAQAPSAVVSEPPAREQPARSRRLRAENAAARAD